MRPKMKNVICGRNRRTHERSIDPTSATGVYEQMNDEEHGGRRTSFRRLILNATQPEQFCDNRISTGKYSILTFVPKFLWEQFRKYNNIFFAFISILQQIPGVSPTGRWTTLAPLVVILLISALKEIIEDVKRHRADQQVNRSVAMTLRNGEWTQVWWQKLRVGDIVKVVDGDRIPADLVLLSSSEPQSLCYIETANLDGETNLKLRKGLDDAGDLSGIRELIALRGSLDCELPNRFLYEFVGTLNLDNETRPLPLGPSNVLQRGSTLRNTTWACGIAAYTGRDCKLMLNSVATPLKRSNTERLTNVQILFLFGLLIFLSVLTIIANVVWVTHNRTAAWYGNDLSAGSVVLQFLTYIILYNNLVPISLQVTLEMVKFMQAMFIGWDIEMYHAETDTPAAARTSNLNEELGQVKFIFSDKTGTLTRNVMEFRGISAAGLQFCYRPPSMASPPSPRRNDTYCLEDISKIVDSKHAAAEALDAALTLLAVCHTVVPGKSADGKLAFHASSPDEAAIVDGMRALGYVFTARTPDVITIEVNGKPREFTLLNVIEFTSSRKRMSVIVRTAEGKIKLFCKGADSVILERLCPDPSANPPQRVADTVHHLEAFAATGLRTLCLAEAELSEIAYSSWSELYREACCSIEDREGCVATIADAIEQSLVLLGATAIEDRLQEGVPETIASLAAAAIKIWVLTGDKQETAVNIGYSCRLLNKDMALIILNSTTLDTTRSALQDAVSKFGMNLRQDNNVGLVVEGAALKWALSAELMGDFLDIALSCRAVICCRASPLQKAEVVSHVKKKCQAITLAIGDGANDVSMIQAADVGVGISGCEGMQAVCASDYSIGQFRFLRRLLFVHGSWSYARVSKLVLYSFYKNVCLYVIELWFAMSSSYSGQILFDRWCISLYNVIFTAAPPLALGVFDRLVEAKILMRYPQLYKTSQEGTLFNGKVFWMWIVNAVVHSVILYFLTVIMLQQGTPFHDGLVGDYLYLGNYVFTYTVVACCLKAGLESQSWTGMHHLALWGSLVTWFTFFSIYGSIWLSVSPGMYGEAVQAYRSPLFWLGMVLIPCITLLRDIVWKVFRRTFLKTLKDRAEDLYEVEQREQQLELAGLRSLPRHDALLPESRTETMLLLQRFFAPTAALPFQPEAMMGLRKIDRGYAFSQEEQGLITQTEVVRIDHSPSTAQH